MTSGELFEILRAKTAEVAAKLPPDLRVSILFDLTGPDPARWLAAAQDGQISLSAAAAQAEADLTVALSTETAVGLLQKTVNPVAAFMTGKVRIKGDPGQIALAKKILAGGLKDRNVA